MDDELCAQLSELVEFLAARCDELERRLASYESAEENQVRPVQFDD